ncbi:MAG: glycosyltransferase, partial [Bacteroidales bacterium]|nr:glycosyltransferase [Bacteroidales bacterium]
SSSNKKKLKFIYWFAYYNLDSPSVRYRAKYPLDFFKGNKGIGNYFIVPSYKPKGIYLFLKAYLSALFFRRPNSLIVIQRVQSNFIYASLLKLLIRSRNKDTVYDLDDADYLEGNPKTIYYFAKNCQIISAGSKQIETYLSQFNNQIVHTTSPIVDLGIVKTNKNTIFTIGWIGGFGGDHKDSLIELVFPALKELTFHLKLIIIGVLNIDDIEFIKKYFQDNSNIEIEIPLEIHWNDEVDIQKRIALFDIGIATLANSEMQLSKSGIQAKQYMNNGVPVLSTNLPENNTVVLEGVNGYFCTTTNDFKEKIDQFYKMTDTDYLQFSKNARKSISNFDHNKYFTDFEKIKNGI